MNQKINVCKSIETGGSPQGLLSLLSRNRDITAIKEEIVDAMRTISSDPAMMAEFAKFISRFHQYSMWNTILIFLQYPGASQIAGFRTWKKLGRYVRRGERGIIILAPMITAIEELDKTTGEAISIKTLHGFKTVRVFAFEQTEPMDGKEFEVPSFGKLITPHPQQVYNRLIRLAARDGIAVDEVPMEFAKAGATNGRVISINKHFELEGKCLTLLHEFGHVLLGHTGERKGIARGQKEVEAESVAFLVALSLGLPKGCYEYIGHWGILDNESIEQALRIADRLIQQLKDTEPIAETA